MDGKQRGEVAKELRTHILDSADALAAERKIVVDDAVLKEVLVKMGPADRVAAMYERPRSYTRSGRPKIVPKATGVDLVIEAIALLGLLLSLLLVLNGIINLPEIIPGHVGFSGKVDSYSDKWVTLSVLVFFNLLIYGLFTIANRYPYVFNFPVVITEENAPKVYRIAQRMMRCLKALFVWMFTIMAWEFVMVLPNDPDQSGMFMLLNLLPLLFFPILLVYSVMKIRKVSGSPDGKVG